MKRPTPNFLLIDAGNTRLKWIVAGRHWPTRISGEIDTKKVTTKWIKALAQKYPNHPTVMASVVPKVMPAFRRTFKDRLVEVNGLLPELNLFDDFPWYYRYRKPGEIGADRLAAAVALQAGKQFPAIIVACGTATAFSVVDAKGRFWGGAIAPGLQAQLDALLAATAQLPATTLRPPHRAVATSSQEAISAGVMLNFQGGVKEILHQCIKELPGRKKPHIFLTGGNAQHLTNILDVPFTLRPLLVFEGLLIIGTRLFKTAS